MNRVLVLLGIHILLCLALIACGDDSTAADITAASCSQTNVQNAINSAADSDTVIIPPGTCIWSTQVIIPNTKGITLLGAGINNTTIRDGGADGIPSGMLIVAVAPGHSVTRVSGVTIDAHRNIKAGSGAEIVVWGSGLNNFRIDHMKIIEVIGYATKVIGNFAGDGSEELSGLVDHVDCYAVNDGIHAPHCFDTHGGWLSLKADSFGFPIELGSNHMVYYEDNSCNYTLSADVCMDAFNGAKFVWRYNKVVNIAIGTHGADSSFRGIHSLEVYRNTFSRSLPDNLVWMNFRSGPHIIFDNTATGNYTGINLQIYRVTKAQDPHVFPYRGLCNGASPWDSNISSGRNPGWGCLDQPGWFFPWTSFIGNNPIAGPVAVAPFQTPIYAWNNLLNGNLVGPIPGNPSLVNYLVADRDYYTEVVSFDGTSGVGKGTLASRPATCTPSSGYWATDQGSWNKKQGGEQGVLYKCTATNTWTLYYTPYTYPHPLQSLQGNSSSTAPPTAPKGITVR